MKSAKKVIIIIGVLASETDGVSINEETGMVTITGSIDQYTALMGEAYIVIPKGDLNVKKNYFNRSYRTYVHVHGNLYRYG